MGVPSFYRWLIGKYPKIVQKAIQVPESSGTEPNPNGIEFDNLYLDMNCIIHQCFHPEDQVPPKTYDEVFKSVFEYTDRIINIVRPRRLLYIAVDGVAPRAKMNQQRAGKFGSARSAEIAELEEDRLREEFKRSNKVLRPKKNNYNEVSDANVITPGTVFMERLSKALEYYVRSRLNSDPAWMNLKVILSDANVPGEGEHKIMSFIRAQRSAEGYNPNLRHCLYGLDADLIMLALSTHEINFFILREVREEFSNKIQTTVSSNFAQGLSTIHEAIKFLEWYEKVINKKKTVRKKPYEFLNICILREYLEIDLSIDEFKVQTERIIDDFIFICFFMGNDFLPNIPSLEAHECALDLLIEVYKKTLKQMGGYLIDTAKMKDKKHAYLNIYRVEKFMMDVGSYEEKVFLKRNNLREKMLHMFSRELAEGDTNDSCHNDLENGSSLPDDNRSLSSSGRTAYNELIVIKNTSEFRRRLNDNLQQKQDTYKSRSYQNDKIRLGYPGWKVRFYQEKFSAENSTEIENTQKTLVEKYMEALCWVLQYYFVGVCSWTWFYPYHYAPFASDLKNLSAAKINFKIGKPLKPFDQLMAVLHPKSSAELPRCYADLMNCKDSPISKFYPKDIEIDMAGKRFLWQGIVKLPFIEEELLLASTKTLESDLQVDEIERNSFRNDKIFVRRDTILGLKLDPSSENLKIPIDFASCEISGVLCSTKGYQDGAVFSSPIGSMEDIKDDFAVSAEYLTPVVDVPVFRLLENTEVPEKTIRANDVEKRELWHEWSSSGNPSTRNNVHSNRSEYRKNTNSTGHTHETWRSAGSGWSTGSTGRGYGNSSRGRGYVGAPETFNPRENTLADASSSGSGRGWGRGSGNAAFPGGTHGQQGAGTSASWRSVGAKPDWAGRGRARN